MRARLLDMGVVAPVRSQSLFRAVADRAAGGAPPVFVLLQPASALVLLGPGEELAVGELEACRERGVPILGWPGDGVRRLDGQRLVFQLIVDREMAARLGLPRTDAERRSYLAELVTRACRSLDMTAASVEDGRVWAGDDPVAAVEVCAVGGCSVALGDLDLSVFSRREVDAPAVAEALVSVLEKSFGVVCEPSMPTPGELEAIYRYDEEVAADERSGLRTAAGRRT